MRELAAQVWLEIGHEVSDRRDVASSLDKALVSGTFGGELDFRGAVVRAKVSSAEDVAALSAAVADWAKSADEDVSLVISGTGMPAGEHTKLYRLMTSFALSTIPEAIQEASGLTRL